MNTTSATTLAAAAGARHITQQGTNLVVELVAVDGLATHTSAVGEVTTLQHELGNDTVELGALVVQGLACVCVCGGGGGGGRKGETK